MVENISVQLEESGNKLFAKKPTAYVFLAKDLFQISLFDEGENEVILDIAKKPKRGIFNFFISRFVIDDFLSSDGSNIPEFARDKVVSYLEELREDAAYSTNLKRARTLSDFGQHFASIVFLISAFETAMKDIFFRSNELWFFRLNTPSVELLDKYGTRLTGVDTNKFQVTVHFGDEKWGFTHEEYDQMKTWQRIHYRTSVFRICKQLGVLDDYLLHLRSNLLREIGSFEILKRTLELQRTRCGINFQMIDGKGGIRWSFGKFIGIDFNSVEKDLQVIKKATSVRHRVIHGFLDEISINETYVKEVEESVTRVVSYVKNEILEWSYVI
jgi:hypothetical protein